MGTIVRLTLVRHGQTPSNVAGLLDTAPPGPGLTAVGLRQARTVPGALTGQPIDALFASDQTRALQTAAPLAAERGLGVRELTGLREVFAGDLEMAGDSDAVHRYIGTLFDWLDGNLRARIPGGPNGFEFLERYDRAVAAIADSVLDSVGPGGAAVAVSHGAAIRAWATVRAVNGADTVVAPPAEAAAQLSVLGDRPDPRHRHLDNTGAVVLQRNADGHWRIEAWHEAAIGGAAVDQPAESGPTA
jgi:probable phosphoglycerate mutase